MAVSAVACAAATAIALSIPASGMAASKAPIKIMQLVTLNTVEQNLPDEVAGGNAAVDAINKAGGIAGHKIQLTQCNDQYNPNTAATCAQQAVSNGDAAVIGSSVFSTSVIPVIKKANIPIIGLAGAQPIDYNDPDSFMWTSSAADWFYEMIPLLKSAGAKDVVGLSGNLPADIALAQQWKYADQAEKIGNKGLIQAPEDATDYLPYAQAVKNSGAKGVAMIIQASQIPGYFTAAKELGATNQYYVDLPGHYPATVISSIGLPLLNQLHLVLLSALPPLNDTKAYPVLKTFKKQMAKYIPNATPLIDSSALQAWMDVQILNTLVPTIKGAITGKAIIHALNHAKKLNVDGIIKNWTPSAKGPNGEVHLSVHKVYPEVINAQGQIVAAPTGNPFKK
jgi:ABC-type branched-subunit amino acid transport system substrate-binding protein